MKICQANSGMYAIGIISWAVSQLSPSSINLVPAQAGKVTVSLASHWPCVTDNSGITSYHLRAHGSRKGDKHPAYAPVEYGTLYLTCIARVSVWCAVW